MHTLEDFTFTIADKDRAVLGTLTRVQVQDFKIRDMGGYGAMLKLRIALDDARAGMIHEREMHYIRVACDGTHVFSGFQNSLVREDDLQRNDGYIEIEFMPLGQILHWRSGYDLSGVSNLVDDGMKSIVNSTFGAGAPTTPTSALSFQIANFTVEANKSESPDTITLDAVDQDIYEALLEYGLAYTVDFDCYFDEDFAIHFETWYPHRGADKSQGQATEQIWSDGTGQFTRVKYGWDGSNVATCVIERDGAADLAASADYRDRFGLRISMRNVTDTTGSKRELSTYGPHEYYRILDFVELSGYEWITNWVLGDKVTWHSTRQGHGPNSDLISGIDVRFDAGGNALLQPIIGREKRTIADKMRGGGSRSGGGGSGGGPGYSDPNPDLELSDLPAHDILSATHDDTLAADVTEGSLIIGNATPKWSALAIGGDGTVLKSNGTTATWESMSGVTAAFVQAGEPSPTWIGQVWVDIS